MQFSRLFGLILLVAVSLTGYGADAEQQNLSGQGSQALAAGDYVGAVTSFSQAIAADKRAVDAYVGIARAYWHQGLAAEGDQAVKKGLRYARRISRVLELHALGIRLGSLLDDPKGIRKARGYYNRGRQVKYSDTHAELHLAMALAWIKAQRLDRAEPLLQKALALDSDWSEDADRAYRRLQMIERASAGSANDVKLAYQASVSRAEITSLLINQIQLAEILERDVGTVSQGETSDQQLTDYHDHPNRDDILTVHRLGLRSLKIRNGRFAPDKPVTRLDLALIIEDILFLKDGISRTQFIGNPSPFSDLKTSNTGFNAVMTAVTRGLIEGRDDGQIQPAAQVSGAETVLVLRRFKKMLK